MGSKSGLSHFDSPEFALQAIKGEELDPSSFPPRARQGRKFRRAFFLLLIYF